MFGLGLWRLKQLPQAIAEAMPGYDQREWLRVRQMEAFDDFFAERGPGGSVLEISPGDRTPWKNGPFASYRAVHYPDFDICQHTLPESFDVVIADQVLEHVENPSAALANMRAMLNPNGSLAIATPFLFRVHARPHDYSRWTAEGLRALLRQAGFDGVVNTGAWGNKACARAHIGGPVRRVGFSRDFSNDPEYPVMVWAFACNA